MACHLWRKICKRPISKQLQLRPSLPRRVRSWTQSLLVSLWRVRRCYPHVNAGASGGMNTAYVTGFGAQPISTGYHSDVFSVSLTESIFNGQASTAIKQSDTRIQASEAALAYAQQVVALEVTQAYFGVLQAQANERVAQQQMDLLQSIYEQTKTSLQVGTGDIISVQEVQAQLDAAKADLISANNAVTVAKNQLERLTHHPVGTLQDITTLQAIGPQPDTLDPWLAAALKNQPLLRQAKATLKVSEQQVQFAKRARWPTLTLSGGRPARCRYAHPAVSSEPDWRLAELVDSDL